MWSFVGSFFAFIISSLIIGGMIFAFLLFLVFALKKDKIKYFFTYLLSGMCMNFVEKKLG
jgi:Mn2+/Fe2+ NRAMP family transporter